MNYSYQTLSSSIPTSWGKLSTTKEMHGEKVMLCFEQILEAAPH